MKRRHRTPNASHKHERTGLLCEAFGVRWRPYQPPLLYSHEQLVAAPVTEGDDRADGSHIRVRAVDVDLADAAGAGDGGGAGVGLEAAEVGVVEGEVEIEGGSDVQGGAGAGRPGETGVRASRDDGGCGVGVQRRRRR
jgi:hypothetical protein